MLNPNSRMLYTSAMTPPPDMFFDEAIGTTFSMDPSLLLEMPVYLALMATDGQSELDPMAILRAIRQNADRITVYVQRGRIQVPQIAKSNPLFGFLGNMIAEVTSPRGGVFHPKLWAIRFVSANGERILYRLVVLTRNMTNDHSWDLSLQLEGALASKKNNGNKPLARFFKDLPELTKAPLPSSRKEQALRFADEIQYVDWELPAGYDTLSFYLPGTKKFAWPAPEAKRMAIISPFCSDKALQNLIADTKEAVALISRQETLSALSMDTRKAFGQCFHLDDAAESEDGEDEVPEHPAASGLHAKVYIYETGGHANKTHLVVGSANATDAVFVGSRNVEILVELAGRQKYVGGIDELLGNDSLGEYLNTFCQPNDTETDLEQKKAEKAIEQARNLLANTDLSVICAPDSRNDLWSLSLSGHFPILPGIVQAKAWPITVNQEFAVTIPSDRTHGEIALGSFSAQSVTGLVAFELVSESPHVSARFVLNLPVSGVPEERNAAILRTVIANQKDFLRYLMLLLGEDRISAPMVNGGSGSSFWLPHALATGDGALLEELTRTYSRSPEKLREIAELVHDLTKTHGRGIVPEDFLQLWSVFETAMGGHRHA